MNEIGLSYNNRTCFFFLRIIFFLIFYGLIFADLARNATMVKKNQLIGLHRYANHIHLIYEYLISIVFLGKVFSFHRIFKYCLLSIITINDIPSQTTHNSFAPYILSNP